MVKQSLVEYYISYWKGASKKELRLRLTWLKTKANTDNVKAEIKAITALIS